MLCACCFVDFILNGCSIVYNAYIIMALLLKARLMASQAQSRLLHFLRMCALNHSGGYNL